MRQPLIASSQTMHGSPLTLEPSPCFRSKTTPCRVQAVGIVKPCVCASAALIAKTLARQRKKRRRSFGVMKFRFARSYSVVASNFLESIANKKGDCQPQSDVGKP